MLIVCGEVVVEQGAIDSVRDELRTMEEATRKEPGCEAYAFSVDINAPTVVRIFERWASMQALQAHFKTPHMAAFGAAMAKIQPRSMSVKAYEVDREVALPR